MAAANYAKSVQSFLGAETYNQLLKTVGKDEISEVNEKLSSKIEEHFQLKEALASLRDENKKLRRGQKTSTRALRKTKEKEEHLVQAYMRQTDEKFKWMDDLEILIDGSILQLEKALESTMRDALSSLERLERAEKGKVKGEHKKQRSNLESTQKRIRTLFASKEQDDKEEKRENEKQALVEILLEQTKNLDEQQKFETEGMDRVFEKLQKERVQEYKTFSKAILQIKLKYQIIQHENISEPKRTRDDITDLKKERTTSRDMSTNKHSDCETSITEGEANTPQACVDESEAKQNKKDKDKHSIKSWEGKVRIAPGPPPPTPSLSPSTSRSPSPPTLLPRGAHPTTPPALPPRQQSFSLSSTSSFTHSSAGDLLTNVKKVQESFW